MTARDARPTCQALDQLSAEEREFTQLIGRMPLVPWTVLGSMRGLSRSAVGEHLNTLRANGIIDWLAGPSDQGRPAWLPYLTDLGRAVAAQIEGVREDAPIPARIHGHPGAEVYQWRLPQLWAIYRLIALIARAGPGAAQVIECEKPWRRVFRPLGSAGSRTALLPARAAVAWPDGTAGEFLLLPDLGYVPPAAYEGAITALLKLRDALDEPLPPLVVSAATSRRTSMWQDTLSRTAEELHEPGLRTYVGCPQSLPAALSSSRRRFTLPPDVSDTGSLPRLHVLRPPKIPVPMPTRPSKREPGKPRLARDAVGDNDLALLLLVGTALAVKPSEVGSIRGTGVGTAYNHCRWLESRHLIGRVPFPVPERKQDEDIERKPSDHARFGLELTYFGLEVLAANHQLPPNTVAEHLGIAARDDPRREERRLARTADGSKPKDDRTRAARRRDYLLGILDHTRGVNRIHARWANDAWTRRRRRGWNDAVVQWRPASKCSASDIQPDAFLVYRRNGQRYGAFVEYDRGSETVPQYRRKLNAYWEYHDSGEYEVDYEGFPVLLIVTAEKKAEDRIVRTFKRMQVGRSPLPVLITTEERVRSEPAGFLGCVWRGLESTFDTRCSWPDMQAALPLGRAAS